MVEEKILLGDRLEKKWNKNEELKRIKEKRAGNQKCMLLSPKMETMDIGDSQRGEGGGEQLPIGYCVPCLGNRSIRSPNLSVTQCTYLIDLHMDPPNLKKNSK